jgi:hypothetical protein
MPARDHEENRMTISMNVRSSLSVVVLAALAACSSSSTPAGTGDGGSAVDAATSAIKGGIGDKCPNGNADCGAGLECAGEDPGGGQCFKVCAPSNDSDCGDTTKYACSNEGHCYLRCTTTADCKRSAEGYVCKDDVPARPPVKFCDTP